jgi:hypothetical protein
MKEKLNNIINRIVSKDNIDLIIIFLLGFLGILSLLYATKWGIGISPDSVTYLDAARNLLEGHGFSYKIGAELQTLTNYPPLYPTLLAVISFILDLDLLQVARGLNALIFGLNIILVGSIMRYAKTLPIINILSSFLVLTSGTILYIHHYAWSEGLFILLGFSGLFLLNRFIEEEKRVSFLFSSVLISLAFLTRYAGLTLIITGLMALLFLHPQKFLKRIAVCIIFGAVSSIPMVLWLARNLYIAGNTTNRDMVYHANFLKPITAFFDNFSLWLLPQQIPIGVRISLVALFIIGLIVFSRRYYRNQRKRGVDLHYFSILQIISWLFILNYLAVLIISVSFFEARIPFGYRMFSPVYIACLILILPQISKILDSERVSFIKNASILLAVIFCLSYVTRFSYRVRIANTDGIEFASKKWKQSELINIIKHLPEKTQIYTNGDDVLKFLTGRNSLSIPAKIVAHNKLKNENYLNELNTMYENLYGNDGVLIWFDNITWRTYLPTVDELKNSLHLKLLVRAEDGSIYKTGS